MAVCPQHLLLSRRLLRSTRILQMVADPPLHGFEGGLDRRHLHAYGLGAARPDVCHSGPAGVGVGVCGYYCVRIELHAFHPDSIFWGWNLTVTGRPLDRDSIRLNQRCWGSTKDFASAITPKHKADAPLSRTGSIEVGVDLLQAFPASTESPLRLRFWLILVGPGKENGWEICSIAPSFRLAVAVRSRAQVRFYDLAVQMPGRMGEHR